ncbi:MAG: DUF507 family protein [Myxococcales bacterium]|jgi:hypothetical protein|nr:DUF507 family protein [Myxococcales bacterium]
MRLYGTKAPNIAHEITASLLSSGDIEAEAPKEVEADVLSVLNQYVSQEKDVSDRTRELLERTGRGPGEFNRVRNQVAESSGIKVGDEALDYLLDQVVAIFHHSANVDEIYVEDVELRRKMRPIFKKYMAADADLDGEVRAQLKHVTEGTRTWDIEYARVMEQIKRKRGLA